MKRHFILICFSLFIFRADAREVTAFMDNPQITKYTRDTQGKFAPQYVLKARKYFSNNTISLLLGSGREASRKRNLYQNGTLTLNNATLYFSSAFYQYGQLVMEGSHGILHGKNFSAQELRFDPGTNMISSSRIFFFYS